MMRPAEPAGRWHRAVRAIHGPDGWRSHGGQPPCTESGLSACFTSLSRRRAAPRQLSTPAWREAPVRRGRVSTI